MIREATEIIGVISQHGKPDADEFIIRMARPEDAERVVELGRQDLLTGPYRDDIADNPEVPRRLAGLLIDNPMAAVLVAEKAGEVVGVYAMAVAPHFYSGEMTACMLIWYVMPEHRHMKNLRGSVGLRLFHEAEQIAKSMGATRMQVTAPTEEVGLAYKRWGFHPIEVGYQRSL